MSRREREGLKPISDALFEQRVRDAEAEAVQIGLVSGDSVLSGMEFEDKLAERRAARQERDAAEAGLPDDVREKLLYEKRRRGVRAEMGAYKYSGKDSYLNTALSYAAALVGGDVNKDDMLERAKWAKKVLDAQKPAPSMWEWAKDKVLKGGR